MSSMTQIKAPLIRKDSLMRDEKDGAPFQDARYSPALDDTNGFTVDLEKGGRQFTERVYQPAAEFKEIHKILREGVCNFGGMTAVLLQIAYPAVGAGVHNHSDFVYRALNRAENTAIYVYAMVFGKPHEREAVKSYVDKMHARVKGGEGPSAYDAKDPETQLWVAATTYAAMIGMYEIVYGPLPQEKAERVYKEFSYLGTSLQMPPELWPENRAVFDIYYQDMIKNHLQVTPEARKLFNDLMHPAKSLPIMMRPLVPLVMPLVKAVTIEQLPANIRTDFGLKSTKMSRFLSSFSTALLIATYPHMPLFIRQCPKTYYMWRMRRMLKKRGLVSTGPNSKH